MFSFGAEYVWSVYFWPIFLCGENVFFWGAGYVWSLYFWPIFGVCVDSGVEEAGWLGVRWKRLYIFCFKCMCDCVFHI